MSLDIIINDLFTVKLNSSHFSRNIDFHYFFSLIVFLDVFLHAVLRVILANALSSALLGPLIIWLRRFIRSSWSIPQ